MLQNAGTNSDASGKREASWSALSPLALFLSRKDAELRPGQPSAFPPGQWYCTAISPFEITRSRVAGWGQFADWAADGLQVFTGQGRKLGLLPLNHLLLQPHRTPHQTLILPVAPAIFVLSVLSVLFVFLSGEPPSANPSNFAPKASPEGGPPLTSLARSNIPAGPGPNW